MSTMQQKRATWALLLMTFIWGYTFIWIKSALNAGDRLLGAEALPITVGLFMVIRFLGAALILPVALPAARAADRPCGLASRRRALVLRAGWLPAADVRYARYRLCHVGFLHESLRRLHGDRAQRGPAPCPQRP